jgi:hypothetical protein
MQSMANSLKGGVKVHLHAVHRPARPDTLPPAEGLRLYAALLPRMEGA